MSDLETQLGSILFDALSADGDLRTDLAESLLSFEDDEPSPDRKATKAEANYKEASDDRECSNCKYYHGDDTTGTCDKVAGSIKPFMWSDYYEPIEKSARSKY